MRELLIFGGIAGLIYWISQQQAETPAPGTVSPILSPASPLPPAVIFTFATGSSGGGAYDPTALYPPLKAAYSGAGPTPGGFYQ